MYHRTQNSGEEEDDDERRHAILAFATGHVWRSRQLRVRCCLLPGQQIVIKGYCYLFGDPGVESQGC